MKTSTLTLRSQPRILIPMVTEKSRSIGRMPTTRTMSLVMELTVSTVALCNEWFFRSDPSYSIAFCV